MVSNILFPSFKEARAKRESAFFTLLFFILSMLAIAAKPEVMLFIFVYAYIILGSLFGGYRILTGKNKLILEQAKKESLTNLNESIKESVKS
jgi:phosphatidylserine synthase